jgi:type IV pilus assembly protein PilF
MIIKKIFYLGMLIILARSLTACTTSEMNQENSLSIKAAAKDNMQLGLAYLEQKDAVHAKEKLLQAIKQAPEDSEIQDAMAYYLELTGDNSPAEKYYKMALKKGVEHNGAAYNNYAAFLCRHKKQKDAEKMFLMAVSDPFYLHAATAYENAGLCSTSTQDFQKAQEYFEMAKRYNLYG